MARPLRFGEMKIRLGIWIARGGRKIACWAGRAYNGERDKWVGSRHVLTPLATRNNIVGTMKSLPVTIRRIGNSLGIVIPKPVLAQVGLTEQADLTVERGAIVLRKPRKAARAGWAQAAQSVANQGEDNLLMGEFGNAVDLDLKW